MSFFIQRTALFGGVLIASVCLFVEANAMSLSDAVATAVRNNPRVGESLAAYRSSKATLRAARSGFLPSITVSANAGAQYLDRPNGLNASNNKKTRFARGIGVGVSQLVFDGFATNNQIRRREAEADAYALRILEASEQLGLDTVEAYIDVLRYRHVYNIAVKNERRHRHILGLIQRQFNEGNSGIADREQAAERVYASSATVADVKRSMADIRAKFRNLVGSAPNKLSSPKVLKARAKSVDAALDEIKRNNPGIRAALADADAAKFNYKSAKGGHMPRVSIEADANFQRDVNGVKGRNNEFQVRGVLSWEVFNGGRTRAQAAAQGERWTESLMRVDRLRRDARESYERAWSAYSTVNDRIRYLRSEEKAGQRLVDAYMKEYEIGQRSLIDVLDAENSLFNTRINLANASAVRIFASYQLEAVLGNLLNRLGVHAPHNELVYERDRPRNLPSKYGVKFEPLRQ